MVQERSAVHGREHIVGAGGPPRAALVLAQHRCELGEERDLARRRARLRRDAVGSYAAAAACELVAHVDDAGGEVDVAPAQGEHLGEAHAGVGAGEKERPVATRTGGEETDEFGAGEDTLLGAQRVRPLVALEPVEGVSVDVPAAKREGEDAAERAEYPLDRPGRKTGRLQFARDRDDVVG